MQIHLILLAYIFITWDLLVEFFAGSMQWSVMAAVGEWGPYMAGTTVGLPQLNVLTSNVEKRINYFTNALCAK